MFEQIFQASNIFHVIAGSLGLAGGVVALSTGKGSRPHVLAGKVFAWMMLFVIVTTLIVMFHEFLPLAIVLSLAVVYLVPSGLLSFNRKIKHFVLCNGILMGLCGLLFIFTMLQFIRINLITEQFVTGPLVLSSMFGFLFVQDWLMFRNTVEHRNFWIRRHLVRMILAFTIAIMALVRIGTNFGLSLETTVIAPLVIAAIVIIWVYRRYPVDSVPANTSG